MKTKKVEIQSSKDGESIAAVIHYSQKVTDRLIILCPGNVDSKDYNHLIKLAETFSKQGYTAIRFDPLGTWDSDGTESDYLTSQYLNDVASVLKYMLDQKPYTEIVLGGHSRGAMISIIYAVNDPRISKIISIMPPSPTTEKELKENKYIDWKKNGFKISVRDVPGSSDTRRYKLPYANLVDKLKFNVNEYVSRVEIPILFVAGELDSVCSPEDVKSIYDKANKPKKYLLLKGIGHDYRHNFSEIEIVNKKIIDAFYSM
jgi:pimeloyl-ACP methyl ester carboxylesterase